MSPPAAPLVFTRKGRSWTSLFSMLAVWLGCVIAYVYFDAALWIVAGIGVFSLPALWDFWTGTIAGA